MFSINVAKFLKINFEFVHTILYIPQNNDRSTMRTTLRLQLTIKWHPQLLKAAEIAIIANPLGRRNPNMHTGRRTPAK